MKLNKNLKLIEDNNKIFLQNNLDENIGEINYNTLELLNLIKKNKSIKYICEYFCNNSNYNKAYVMENIEKILKYLIANDIVLED